MLCRLLQIALAPILLLQGRQVRRRTLRLPEPTGPRHGLALPKQTEANQRPSLQLLILGDSSAAGVGVAQQQDALAMPLAQQLAEDLQRPVAWQLLAKSGLSSADLLAQLSGPWKHCTLGADCVLLVLGVNDCTGGISPKRFGHNIRRILHLLHRANPPAQPPQVLLSAVPDMRHMPALPAPLKHYLGCRAKQLDRQLLALSQTAPTLHYLATRQHLQVSDCAADGFHPGASGYRTWAALAARASLKFLHSPPPPAA